MLRSWTISRAAALGTIAGLVSVALWLLFAAYQEPFRLLYTAALIVTAFCGLSILGMTVADILLRPRRGGRVIPIRAFDVGLGLLLAVPPLVTLHALLR